MAAGDASPKESSAQRSRPRGPEQLELPSKEGELQSQEPSLKSKQDPSGATGEQTRSALLERLQLNESKTHSHSLTTYINLYTYFYTPYIYLDLKTAFEGTLKM